MATGEQNNIMTETERLRREKISKALKGKKKPPFSAEHIEKIRMSRMGKKLSEETKAKMWMFPKGNQYAKGYKHTDEWKIEARKRKPNLGIKMKEETKLKISLKKKGIPLEKNRGNNHPNWKGGITKIHIKIRNSLEMKLWRRAVLLRDNYTCVWCGSNEKLDVDHIKRFADYPELRFAIDNGRTLCRNCHLTTETYGGKK